MKRKTLPLILVLVLLSSEAPLDDALVREAVDEAGYEVAA